MATVDRHAHWQNVYSTKEENEVSWFQESPTTSFDMIQATGATPGSAIIDIGGGASRLVDTLLDHGYSAITVLDLSEAAFLAARNRIGSRSTGVEWIVGDVTIWNPSRQYNIWHDRAAFHFLTEQNERAAYVERLRKALGPDGQAIIGTFSLDGPERCSGLPVARYDARSLAAILGSPFTLIETRTEEHRTPWGSTQPFQFSRFTA